VADEGSKQRKPGFKTALEDVKALATVLAMEVESALGRRTAQVLGLLALFALVVGTLLAFLTWYIAPSDAAQRQDLVVTIAQILGGAALLSGLYFTWRTLQVNRQGQITERFTRAIEQLGATDDEGHKRLEIRLGGIYALERIAKDSPERDYSTVMEVLSAYVRENTRLLASGEAEQTKQMLSAPPQPLPEDIQAVMDIIGRRQENKVPAEYQVVIDLSRANFSRAGLRGAKLRGVDLQRADFQDADLQEGNLITADLRRANLQRANLRGAKLQGAKLRVADLRRANLNRAHLQGADLRGADFQDADLRGHLEGANLEGAHLQGADLRGAFLRGADLQGAYLQKANLFRADLREAKLQKANLQKADLIGASLEGAQVTDEQLASAESLQGAIMPDGSKHP
jgi:uncharacterized protein YjbI with pentapeptide repeats